MTSSVGRPFLYRARIVPRSRARVPLSARRWITRSCRRSTPQGEPLPLDPSSSASLSSSFLQEKSLGATRVPTSIPRTLIKTINSTITPEERSAFERILQASTEERELPGVADRSPFVDAVDTDVDSIIDIFASPVETRLLEDDDRLPSPQDESFTPEKSQSGSESSFAPGEHDAELTRHSQPTSSTSLGGNSVSQLDKDLGVYQHSESQSNQQAVRDSLSDISRALQEAASSTTQRGDVAMWEICESRIFSLARCLQPPPPKQPKSVRPTRFTFSRAKSDDPVQIMEAADREQRVSAFVVSPSQSGTSRQSFNDELVQQGGHQALPLAVLRHLYPAALLLALRLYAKHFPASPLPHNLLPRIRAVGHTSYVLGTSPQLYNSLMSLVWLTRSSLREIDALLSEMERGGVEYNEETYRILRHIETERASDLGETADTEAPRGKESQRLSATREGRGAAWWNRHEQTVWLPRIIEWLQIIKTRLDSTKSSAFAERTGFD